MNIITFIHFFEQIVRTKGKKGTNRDRKGATIERSCLIFLSIAFAGLIFLTGCQSSGDQDTTKKEKNAGSGTTDAGGGELNVPSAIAKTKTMPFNLYGMNCSKCAKKAENALQSMEGIEQAKVMFESKTGWIQYRADSGITKDKVRQELKTTGRGLPPCFREKRCPRNIERTTRAAPRRSPTKLTRN